MESGPNAISKNCGQTLETFDVTMFETIADIAKTDLKDKIIERGLYMPCAFFKEDFVKSGGYPHGNVYTGGVGKIDSSFVMSGDDAFFHHNPIMMTKKHITVCDSVVYHFQTGEMDS
jgi:hypothetical protein